MATPRSESIKKAESNSSEIRSPEEAGAIENKIDHYAVLAQVINEGVAKYFQSISEDSNLHFASSLNQLASHLRGEVGDAVLNTLLTDSFKAHFDSLHKSQIQRHEIDATKFDDVMMNILAGTTTFVGTFSHTFTFIQRHFGTELAAHPNNWRMIDRLAKLQLHQLSAYYNTYLSDYQRWPDIVEQLDISDDGVKFRAGYPNEAFVTIPASQLAEHLRTDLDDEALVSAQIQDMDTSDKIGCPVTFSPAIIKDLWTLYTHHAYRIVTKPAIPSSDDSEAFRQ